MARKLNKISQLSKNAKSKLRSFIKKELGLAKNVKLKKLFDMIGVKTENQLYKSVKKKYNEYIEEQNKIIEKEQAEKRALNAFKSRAKKIISTLENKTFKNLNQNKLRTIIQLLQNTKNKYLIHVGNKTYTLTDEFMDKILDVEYESVGEGSDKEMIEKLNDISTIRIEK